MCALVPGGSGWSRGQVQGDFLPHLKWSFEKAHHDETRDFMILYAMQTGNHFMMGHKFIWSCQGMSAILDWLSFVPKDTGCVRQQLGVRISWFCRSFGHLFILEWFFNWPEVSEVFICRRYLKQVIHRHPAGSTRNMICTQLRRIQRWGLQQESLCSSVSADVEQSWQGNPVGWDSSLTFSSPYWWMVHVLSV